MAKYKDLEILDLTGGLITDRSDFFVDNSQLVECRNFDLEERGRLKRRKGFQRYTGISTGILINSTSFSIITLGSSPTFYHVIIDVAPDATLYRVVGSRLNGAVTTASTTIDLDDGTLFASSGNIEIEGDIIAYSGKSTDQLTGVTGILTSHATDAPVHQIVSVGASGVDTRAGAYFATLNNTLFINGRAGSATYDGSSISAVSDADEPGGILATVYRQRIYVVGSGIADASGTRNGSPIRVSFSDEGSATSWDINNFFDVEDERGEMITALADLDDRLYIFKQNSVFFYDEFQLKQTRHDLGAYNEKVVQKLGNNFITFCPSGIWVTNGVSAEKISDPIKKYLDSFAPIYDNGTASIQRVVINCSSGIYNEKYLLFLNQLIVDRETISGVVFVYDTRNGKWTMYTDFPGDIRHFASLRVFNQGFPQQTAANITDSISQSREALFAGDASGKYWRFFDNKERNSNVVLPDITGADIIADNKNVSTGTGIQTIGETKWYPIVGGGWGTAKSILVYLEKGIFQVAYKLDKGSKQTDWISLGEFNSTISSKDLLDNSGYRIKFKITSNQENTLSVFNGFILQGRESLTAVRK